MTLSMSPIPNGGFMFEMHKEKILVIENATFDNNLQYLLSMGTKSLADILNTELLRMKMSSMNLLKESLLRKAAKS